MLVSNNQINMRAEEWSLFKELTFAPWRPRTVREFNAMAELGAARHMIDNTDGIGWMHALSCEEIKFGSDGEVNFPIDKRRMEYVRVHGTWPSEEELRAFNNVPPQKPGAGIRLVGSPEAGSASDKAD